MSRITPWNLADMWFSDRSVKTTENSHQTVGIDIGTQAGHGAGSLAGSTRD